MVDFNNNVFISIKQRGPTGFKKLTTATTALKELNAELNLLVSSVTRAQAVADLDFSRIKTIGTPGVSDEQTKQTTTNLDNIAKNIEKVNEAQNNLKTSSIPFQKAFGNNAKAMQEVVTAANNLGISIKGATTSVKTLENGTKQLITRLPQANGAMFKFNSTTKTMAQTHIAGGIAVSSLTGKIALQSISIAGIIGKVLIWTAATTAVFGAINLLKTSLSVFTEFEGQMIALARVAAFSTGQIQQLTAETIKLATGFGSSIDNAQEATVSLARLGLTATETAVALEAALLAEAVAELSVEDATKKIIAATNQFNIEISQSIRIIDEFNELSNKNAVTVNDLASAVTIAGSVFNAYGAEIQDLNALTTVLAANTAKSGNEIGNALKTISSFTFRPETIRTLESLTGIEIEADTGDLKDLDLVLAEIAFRFDQFTEAEQNQIVTSIAGARQRNFGIIVLKKFDEVIEKNIQQLNATGSAAEEAIPVLASFGSQVKQLGTNFDSAKIAIGETLSQLIGSLIPAANILTNVLKTDIVQIGLMTLALAALGAIIGIATTAFILLISSVGALAIAFPPVAVAIGIATVVLGLFANSILKGSGELRKFQEELAKSVAELEKLRAVEEAQIDRQKRTASILEQIAASARGSFFNAKGELVAAKELERARGKILKLIDGVVKAGEISKKQAESLSKDEKIIGELIDIANQKRKTAIELQEKQVIRARGNVEDAEQEKLSIEGRIVLLDQLISRSDELSSSDRKRLVNSLAIEGVSLTEVGLSEEKLRLKRSIEIQEQKILTANKQIAEVSLKITESQLKRAVATQEIDAATEKRLRKIGALRVSEANKQLRLQDEFSRNALDIFAESDLDKSINELKILNQSLSSINFQIDRVSEKIKITVDDKELKILKGALVALESDAKVVGEGIAKVSIVGIPINVFSKFFSDSKEVTRETVAINKRLVDAFITGGIKERLLLERELLKEEIKRAEAIDQLNLSFIEQRNIQQRILDLNAEQGDLQKRIQQETILFLIGKNQKEKESLRNAQKEALLLGSRAEVLGRLKDIEDIQKFEVGDISFDRFIALDQETKKLFQEFNKPVFEDIQRQRGIPVIDQGKEAFDAVLQLDGIKEALEKMKSFSEETPDLVAQLVRSGLSAEKAAEAIQLFTEVISNARADPSDIVLSQGAEFFGNIASGLTKLNDSLQLTIIDGIANVAREIAETQNVVLGVRLKALEQTIKDLTTQDEHDNN